MLQKVSWIEYLILIGIGVVVYYIYVLVKYFPREIAKISRVSKKQAGDEEEESDEEEIVEAEVIPIVEKQPSKADRLMIPATNGSVLKTRKEQPAQEESVKAEEGAVPEEIGIGEENQSLLIIGRELSQKIRAQIIEAAEKKLIREELMMGLQLILRKDRYQRLRENQLFVKSINSQLLFEVEQHCSIQLDAAELKGLWIQ